jgi:hypothetical protein
MDIKKNLLGGGGIKNAPCCLSPPPLRSSPHHSYCRSLVNTINYFPSPRPPAPDHHKEASVVSSRDINQSIIIIIFVVARETGCLAYKFLNFYQERSRINDTFTNYNKQSRFVVDSTSILCFQ